MSEICWRMNSQQHRRKVALRRLQPAQAGFALLLVQFQLPHPLLLVQF
jgi:hypothetical protein